MNYNLDEIIAQDNQENGETNSVSESASEVVNIFNDMMIRMIENMKIAELCALVTEKIRKMGSVHVDELYSTVNTCTCGKCGGAQIPRKAFDELINLGVLSGCILNNNGTLTAVRN